MDFEFSSDQELLRETVRRFLSERAPVSWVRAQLDDDRGFTPEVWSELSGLGVCGLLVPEEHGGAGMGMVDAAVVLEELGRAVHPAPFGSSAIGAAGLITGAGTREDHGALLPSLANGEHIGSVALYEPDRGTDWSSPSTCADRSADGWVVTGHKVWVPDAMAADVLVVVASVDGTEPGVFVVDAGAPGLAVEAIATVDGTRKHGSIRLTRTPARRLGGGDARGAVVEAVDRLLVATVVEGVGTASRALEIAVDYAKERRQFDRPIGSFQAVQHLCADMLRSVELARAGAYYACWAADAGGPAERHRAATMAQAYAADELYRVGASLIQVLGGIGFTWEHDAHLYYKRLLTLQQHGGGTAGQLDELASLILD